MERQHEKFLIDSTKIPVSSDHSMSLKGRAAASCFYLKQPFSNRKNLEGIPLTTVIST